MGVIRQKKAYGTLVEEGSGPGYWDVQVRTTGKRNKRLTAMLNRRYRRGYLVWRERNQ
jgi:hypothetical protein